jgi:hypothetical protein
MDAKHCRSAERASQARDTGEKAPCKTWRAFRLREKHHVKHNGRALPGPLSSSAIKSILRWNRVTFEVSEILMP